MWNIVNVACKLYSCDKLHLSYIAELHVVVLGLW